LPAGALVQEISCFNISDLAMCRRVKNNDSTILSMLCVVWCIICLLSHGQNSFHLIDLIPRHHVYTIPMAHEPAMAQSGKWASSHMRIFGLHRHGRSDLVDILCDASGLACQ